MIHTPGPWSQGRLLITLTTKNWPKEEFERMEILEKLMVFSDFKEGDQGRSRKLIAQCQTEADAKLIAAAPELLERAQMVVSVMTAVMNDPKWKKAGLPSMFNECCNLEDVIKKATE